MRNFTKKLLVSLVVCLILSLCATGVYATEEKTDITLFDRAYDYVKYNPYGGGDAGMAWNLLGPDAIENVHREYPISFTNNSEVDSAYYYVAGSNNISALAQFESLIAFLENDYVVEYELEYDRTSEGYISVVVAYNYSYYIDAYISCDGTGDICIVTGDGAKSVMDVESILSSESADNLISAVYGNGKSVRFAEKIMVSVRVTSNDNGMPEKIDMYLNGCHVASTNESFSDEVASLTPEYPLDATKGFPEDKLGNIIAIKAGAGVDCNLNSLCLYTVDSNNTTPSSEGLTYYKYTYRNDSYTPDISEDTTEEATTEEITTEEITSEDTTADETTENLTSDEVVTDATVDEVSSDEITEGEESVVESTESATTSKVVDEPNNGDVLPTVTESASETETETEAESGSEEESVSEEVTTKAPVSYEGKVLDVVPTLCLVFGISGVALIVIAIVILKLRVKKK